MVSTKREGFELLDTGDNGDGSDEGDYHYYNRNGGNYTGSITKLTCGERNGFVMLSLDHKRNIATIISFNVDIQKPHATEHLLHQLIAYLKELGYVDKCVFEHSLTDAFNEILKSNGFMPSDEYQGKYSLSIDNHRIQESYLENITNQKQPRVRLSFQCEFKGNFANISEEKTPELHMFLSQNASSHVIKLPLELDQNQHSRGKLEFWYDLHSKSIPETVLWNLACFDQIKNKHGEFCINQAGNASIPLVNIANICTMLASSASSKTKQIVLVLQVPSSSPTIEKGKFYITVDKNSFQFENAEFTKSIEHEITPQDFETAVNRYISSVVSDYKHRVPLYKGIENIHAYQYVSSVGNLPAMFYQHFQIPPTSESYWLNALEIILARHGLMDLTGFSEGKGGEKYASRVVAELCALYVNYCRYITDKVLKVTETFFGPRRGIKNTTEELLESFDLVRPRNAGDCEDFGKEALIESFQLGKWFNESSTHPALRRLYDIRNKYYAFSALGAVASATINGDYGQQQFGAHEWLVLVPKSWFYQCVSRSNKSSPFALPGDANIGNDLDVQIIEGTGMLRPDGEGQESFPQGRDYLESVEGGKSAFANLRRIYFYDRKSGSNFYKIVITLFTNEFLIDQSGLPHVGEFVVETVKPVSSNRNSTFYGALFTDFINKKDNVQIVPQVAVADELFYHITNAQQNEYPILPLEPPLNLSKQPLPTDAVYPLVEYSRGIKNREDMEWNPPVEYFMRFDQGTPERIQSLMQVIKSSGGYIEITREPVSGTQVGGWRLLVYLSTEIIQ